MPELSEILAQHQGTGYVIAPAGFGKTHLIVEAVSHTSKRQLVLTHTYAGVNVLRRKFHELRVGNQAFHVDTIASWALRLSLSYPGSSGWTIARPAGNEWSALYRSCSALLERAFIQRILRASYSGLYVDEYQDCSLAQHQLVLKLASLLPCRMLGDPLQGIFDFNEQPLDWVRDVSDVFEPLGQLQTPHRWNRAGAPAIGEWLRVVRDQLERGQPVDLTRNVPQGVTFKPVTSETEFPRVQADVCRFFRCDARESVIAIHGGSSTHKAKCHALAKRVGGRFSSIEEIEGKALFSFIERYQSAQTGQKRLKLLVEFTCQCMTGVRKSLPAATVRGEHTIIRENTRNPQLAGSANAFLVDSTSDNLSVFLNALKALDGIKIVRADLFGRMVGVLRKHSMHPELTLTQAAEKYHVEFRHRGRMTSRRNLIGTTLLVKGLEFDHAIVLEANSLSKKELYVALTRGGRSLTIISSSPVLNPTT